MATFRQVELRVEDKRQGHAGQTRFDEGEDVKVETSNNIRCIIRDRV